MIDTRPTRFPRGVYGITPEWTDTDRLLHAVEKAAEGGMKVLQWRRKTGDEKQRWAQAAALRELCRKLGVLFIVNDSIEAALRLDADGVHLGRDDGPLDMARQALGPGRILGTSCYNQPELAAQALKHDVDYVAFGAVYPSSVKPHAVRATVEHIQEGRRLIALHEPEQATRVAVVAIGGITADNAAPLVQAGTDSLAMISGLFDVADIQETAQRCTDLFTQYQT
ncbi:MAG TPA: thiamine phosphate synthase [Pusillimonas sp.]|uniref:thiamine phosphate synthase n=1 Tax=unclassified Pusillimonas TaxID=2640016 RepID=UPI00261F950D|nr:MULTISPECIES: thiamine phosphate synthase [unclassified Pusillimonas]HLU19621.1 thiamine phosphate synthase [Pusillimonas sp.]